MSSSIWTRSGGRSNFTRYRGDAWRAVEAQHVIATRRLVDSDAEQHLLEELLEEKKPPVPEAAARLHYLLSTPFRYPPLKYGSRFGTRSEPSLWYGAESRRTVFAETAYYRLLLLDGTEAELGPVLVELSAFSVAIDAARAGDLTAPPFVEHHAQLASRTDYAEAQRCGHALREDNAQLVRYPSARDVEPGVCVGVFDPGAFAHPPRALETWDCASDRNAVEFSRRSLRGPRAGFRFPRGDFEVRGKLPAPAL